MIHEYDATLEQCPLPLVKMRLLLKKMSNNDKCLIRIADKGSISDIPKYLDKSGYTYKTTKVTPSIIEILIHSR